jgi:hypothetical protein
LTLSPGTRLGPYEIVAPLKMEHCDVGSRVSRGAVRFKAVVGMKERDRRPAITSAISGCPQSSGLPTKR